MKVSHLLCLFVFSATIAHAQSVFSVKDEGEARNRHYHVVHYKIEVSFDEGKKMVNGRVTTTLTPFPEELTTVEFDAESLHVGKVSLGGKDLRFDIQPKTIAIHLDKPYTSSDTFTVVIDYSATPKKGLYFVQPDSGAPDKPWQIWSQGEDMNNHFWFPCYDFPNDKATSEVIATVRSAYTVLSNGKLVDVKEDKKNGTKTFHWSETKPHSSYLIMMAAGEYAILRDKAGKLPVEYYVYRKDSVDAWACLRETPAMIKFFNEKIGFPYPWEKYAQVQIADFMYGGMENTSATTMADDALVYDARRRIDGTPTTLIAHELAHQWWGDVVTCKDWRHLWLNESFASYFDPLYHEFSLGRDEFDYRMYRDQLEGINVDTSLGRKPVVSVGSYTANVYPRGASILHMMRFVLGDKLFWRAINHYITKNQFRPVETNDLKLAIEEATGQNLYWFFDQWLYKAGHPIFALSYRWDEAAKVLLLHIKQTQKMDTLTGIFRTPVDVEITTDEGANIYRVDIASQETTMTLPASAKPKLVIFDKGNWLLKELFFDKSSEEWSYQAEFAGNPVDRIRALGSLAGDSLKERFVSLFGKSATKDPFWGVRQEAIASLKKINVKKEGVASSMKTPVIAASGDPKSSVRSAAVDLLGSLRGEDVVAAVRKALNDSSYSVVQAALRSLSTADSANALPTINAFLATPSAGNRLSNTALSLLGKFDSASAVRISLEKAKYGKQSSERRTALTVLSKYGKGRSDVLAFVTSLIEDKDRSIRRSAVRTLGEIGNESTVPLLEKISANKEDDAAGTAKESLGKIKKKMNGKG